MKNIINEICKLKLTGIQRLVLIYLFENPEFITIKDLVNSLNSSRITINNAIYKLSNLDLIEFEEDKKISLNLDELYKFLHIKVNNEEIDNDVNDITSIKPVEEIKPIKPVENFIDIEINKFLNTNSIFFKAQNKNIIINSYVNYNKQYNSKIPMNKFEQVCYILLISSIYKNAKNVNELNDLLINSNLVINPANLYDLIKLINTNENAKDYAKGMLNIVYKENNLALLT